MALTRDYIPDFELMDELAIEEELKEAIKTPEEFWSWVKNEIMPDEYRRRRAYYANSPDTFYRNDPVMMITDHFLTFNPFHVATPDAPFETRLELVELFTTITTFSQWCFHPIAELDPSAIQTNHDLIMDGSRTREMALDNCKEIVFCICASKYRMPPFPKRTLN